ncbi:hypothetical protein SS50377_21180 [Spironucleus salmonicida]|uniref:Uncharacterized protein n=1 Tax=Spironucleus salmonicida TaxID=348837 RepID=V6LHD4_9EUKA|nr:hypothetical protein SS50377_21180 [Spironucleus salmonicida]|eukprot:EST43957.1 Hypothetical protein SS50377_16263 [Spironucleus salmonicida]
MDISILLQQLHTFPIPQSISNLYKHCADPELLKVHNNDTIGITSYPQSQQASSQLPLARFFLTQKNQEQTQLIFLKNMKLLMDFINIQFFPSDLQIKRETRFALAKQQEFRDASVDFVFSSLKPSFDRVIKWVGDYDEFKIIIRAALWLCVDNDARRERGEPETALDEFMSLKK